jgi:hypothetical protein
MQAVKQTGTFILELSEEVLIDFGGDYSVWVPKQAIVDSDGNDYVGPYEQGGIQTIYVDTDWWDVLGGGNGSTSETGHTR